MAKSKRPHPRGSPRPDRFATHRRFVNDEVPRLKKATGSSSAGLALLMIWDWADGRTGHVKGLSVTRLADAMCVEENTARAALAAIVAAKLLKVIKPGKVPVYELSHIMWEEPES